MFNMRNKMKICAVINKEIGIDEKYSYRVGRKCYLPECIKEGEPIQWLYEDGLICTSSPVTSFDEVCLHTRDFSRELGHA